MNQSADLLPGTLGMLILKTVSVKPLHGYGVLLRAALGKGRQGASRYTDESDNCRYSHRRFSSRAALSR